jgi:arsenite methyltransferase
VNVRGDERVLDLGCGRGAILTMAARCLTSGNATGVDIWKTPRSVRQLAECVPSEREP